MTPPKAKISITSPQRGSKLVATHLKWCASDQQGTQMDKMLNAKMLTADAPLRFLQFAPSPLNFSLKWDSFCFCQRWDSRDVSSKCCGNPEEHSGTERLNRLFIVGKRPWDGWLLSHSGLVSTENAKSFNWYQNERAYCSTMADHFWICFRHLSGDGESPSRGRFQRASDAPGSAVTEEKKVCLHFQTHIFPVGKISISKLAEMIRVRGSGV